MTGSREAATQGVLSLAMLLLDLIDVEALRGVRITVPEAVRAGASVSLSCDYDLETAPLYSIRWYHGDEEFYRYVPKESPPYKVFPMPAFNVDMSGSDSRQVTLRDVQRELSGYYKCEVSADAPLFHTDIRSKHMTVVEIPKEGPTLIIDIRKIALGATLKANCTGPVSHHYVNLTWYLNGEQLQDGPGVIQQYHRARRRYNGSHSPTAASETEPNVDHTQVSLQVDPTTFRQGKLRLRCLATMYTLYRRTDELEILEDTPQVAMVMRPTEASHSHYQIYEGYSQASTLSLSNICVVVITSTILT